MTIDDRTVEANGLTFTARETAAGGEPVMLLHGFPETSAMWTTLMDQLGRDGYHCFAPDQRGYSPGARPPHVDAYRYEHLAADVFALAAELGWDSFHLIGHDWGAIAGWAMLAVDPAPVRSWSALSVPHAKAFGQAVWEDPDEAPYRAILEFFIDPTGQAEQIMGADDFAVLKAAWSSSDEREQLAYLSVLRQPGALTAALNWYRASNAHRHAITDQAVTFGPVSTPTLVLRGMSDDYIRQMSFDLAKDYMTGPYRLVELEASHWLVQDQPDQVHAEVLAHLQANRI